MEVLIVQFFYEEKPRLGFLVTRVDDQSVLVYSDHCLYLCSSMGTRLLLEGISVPVYDKVNLDEITD